MASVGAPLAGAWGAEGAEVGAGAAAAEGAGGVFGAAGCCLDDVVGRGNGCGVCADSVEAAVTTMLITTIRASRFTALL
ncbi:MAG: hypothetical protein CK533_13995 [Acidobacterium sp.]|nr:MAG: hypothetical protein CK533_13995 [Acidobacterium sp.]